MSEQTKTLLEIARTRPSRQPVRRPITEEEIELALAWLRSEIVNAQAHAALFPHGNPANAAANTVYRLAICLREAYRIGRLIETPEK